MTSGMIQPNYAAMTVTELTNAVAKLLMHTSPCTKAGKGWINPMALNAKAGKCTGPRTCQSSPLVEALRKAARNWPGDTADERKRRAWVRHIINNGLHQWLGGNVTLLQQRRNADFFNQARRYAALA